ncbi:hypothetical protein [Paenibacillus koleovorans]|uniref:hypothetical protein n=1 Tax=Paenibacillus koleovorans TaxID=121608 RepID=UPI000FD838DD|nr:hypothetical protein [Paenibacillus koleovorans]
MHKLLLFVLLLAFLLVMNALQTDEQGALQALFEGKRAVNRAAHAAVQQVDQAKLADGIFALDAVQAESAGLAYLQANMHLDSANEPLPGAFWKAGAEVVVFEVINEDRAFPYTYTNASYDVEVTLNRPGVVMVVHVEYPRVFRVLRPVEWHLKGVGELVY